MNEIYNMSKQIEFNNLTYKFKDENLAPIDFIGFRGPFNIYENVKYGNISTGKSKSKSKAI